MIPAESVGVDSDLADLLSTVESQISTLDQIILDLSSCPPEPNNKRKEMENQSSTSLGPTLIKKLKLTIRSPSSDCSSAASSPVIPARPCGYKNLVRVKELSRRMSIDLENVKGKTDHQIPINTFWTFIEPFFGPLTEEDFAFLRDDKLEETLFLVPPVNNSPLSPMMKNLSFRIVALLLAEGQPTLPEPLPVESEDEEAEKTQDPYYQTECVPDLQHRIFKELSIIGLPMMKVAPEGQNIVDSSFKELKCSQYCLKAVHEVNCRRKKMLSHFLESKMASQEYYSILDELDKQIEVAYTKKYKIAKKKKRNVPVDIEVECPEVLSLLAKRATLVDKYSSIILPRDQLSQPFSGSLIDGKAEEEIGKRFEIPSLSDREAREIHRIGDIVAKSQVKVWPKDK